MVLGPCGSFRFGLDPHFFVLVAISHLPKADLLIFCCLPVWSMLGRGPKRLTFYFWALWASEILVAFPNMLVTCFGQSGSEPSRMLTPYSSTRKLTGGVPLGKCGLNPTTFGAPPMNTLGVIAVGLTVSCWFEWDIASGTFGG